MECERLNRLVRSWYVQVQEESLAPARMVEFMEKHLKGCGACLADPDVRAEVKKITEIVLPPSKMVKAVREDADEEEVDDSPSPYYAAEDEDELSVGDGGEEEEEDDEEEEEDEFIPSMIDDDDDLSE
ncbi:MAG: hypothetical protein M0P70_14620 [Desulfobulbaceae bacterium]|nr:hypothetical protein [Desulfobulbaceae bacterium]